MTKSFDIGIRCDFLLTLENSQIELQKDFFVGIKGAKILEITPWTDQTRDVCICKKFIYKKNQLVMPGLINGHTHLPMTLLRGLSDDEPLNVWLFKTIIPLESKLVSEDFVTLGTELAALESIRFGTTTVNDMYFYENKIAETIDKTGLRALVSEGVLDFPTPDNKGDLKITYRILDEMREKFKNSDRIYCGIAPHAPYTCNDETLKGVINYAQKNNFFIHTHLSETAREVEDSLKEFKKTPIQRFADLGVFDKHSICAHGVHITPKDIQILKKHKASIIYNPESNMKLCSGIAPIKALLENENLVGLGTDGAASNNDLCLFGEMDTGAKLQKLQYHESTALTAKQILIMATLGGAKALNIDTVTGSIEINKFADIIFVDLEQPHLKPLNDIASTIVYSAKGPDVTTVICHGKLLYEDKQYFTLDPESIYHKIEHFQTTLRKALQ